MRDTTKITSQSNQVTERDKSTFTTDEGEARLAATPLTLESAYGSVKPSKNPEDFEAISRNAKDSKAEETLRELSEA